MRDPNLMGITPWELERYTPGELEALLAYCDAKRDALGSS